MAEQLGFLEQLGLPSTDERALAAAARAQQPDANRALGMGARRGLGAMLGGIGGLVTGKDYSDTGTKGGRSFKGFLENVKAGALTMEDIDAARVAGITPEELKARRAIRKEVSQFEPTDDFYQQEAMAERVAAIAKKYGSPTLVTNSLRALDNIKDQRLEYDKLLADKRYTEALGIEKGLYTAFDELDGGKPVSGHVTFKDGKYGLETADGFRAFGADFHLYDRAKNTRGMIGLPRQIRGQMTKTTRNDINKQITAATATIGKIDKVATALKSWAGKMTERTGAGGNFAQTAGNVVRGAVGIVKNLATGFDSWRMKDQVADSSRDWSGLNAWNERVQNGTDELWSFLPAELQANEQAAIEHRARLMDLAYMVARMAEPSNRGLSDNDIENALTRIASAGTNPQALVNRLTEIMAEGIYETELMMAPYTYGWDEEDPQYTTEKVEEMLWGPNPRRMRTRRDEFLKKHKLEVDPDTHLVRVQEGHQLSPTDTANLVPSPEEAENKFETFQSWRTNGVPSTATIEERKEFIAFLRAQTGAQ